MEFLRRNVIGLLALFVALGGTAAAVSGQQDGAAGATAGAPGAKATAAPVAQAAKNKRKKKKVKTVAGPQGPPGKDGASGGAGPSMLLSSGPPVVLAADINGVPTGLAYLPLSGSANSGSPDDVTQVIPQDVTITSIVGVVKTTVSTSFPATVKAQLYVGSGFSTPVAVAGGSCSTQEIPGLTSAGHVAPMSCTGLSIPLTVGDRAYIELTVSFNPTAADSIAVRPSISLGTR
jgi:hypothetical protein